MNPHIEYITTLLQSVEKKKPKKPAYKKSQALRELEKLAFEHHYKNSSLPEQYRSKFKFKDNTANTLTTAIITYIKLNNGSAFRVNSQGQYDAKLKKWRHSGTRKGLPDIQAVVNGQFIGIEVKIGLDRQSTNQKKVQSEIEASGGIYFLAKDFESFKQWFDNQIVKKNENH